jgi:hypothetical protein
MAEGQKKSGTFASCLRAHLQAEPHAIENVPLDDLKPFVTDKANRAAYVAELESAGFVIIQQPPVATLTTA